MDGVVKLPLETDSGLSLSQLRIDLARDTRIHVCRNINGHIYVTLGKGREATLIIHPHAAARLVASIEAELIREEAP